MRTIPREWIENVARGQRVSAEALELAIASGEVHLDDEGAVEIGDWFRVQRGEQPLHPARQALAAARSSAPLAAARSSAPARSLDADRPRLAPGLRGEVLETVAHQLGLDERELLELYGDAGDDARGGSSPRRASSPAASPSRDVLETVAHQLGLDADELLELYR